MVFKVSFCLQAVFPNVTINQCSNHLGRHLRKNLENAHPKKSLDAKQLKEMTQKHGELADWVGLAKLVLVTKGALIQLNNAGYTATVACYGGKSHFVLA